MGTIQHFHCESRAEQLRESRVKSWESQNCSEPRAERLGKPGVKEGGSKTAREAGVEASPERSNSRSISRSESGAGGDGGPRTTWEIPLLGCYIWSPNDLS